MRAPTEKERRPREAAAEPRAASQGRVERAYRFADLSGYTPRQRLLIRAADFAFYLFIRLIGRTARFRVEGWEHWEAAHRGGPPILAFWHEQIFLTTYYFRHRRIVVMTSRSLDGEYIARFIQRFGYGAARGSSTRGGVGALVEMARLVRAGCPAGFTVDGPRGPRRVAKTGALLLAKKTGRPVLPFAVEAERYWTIGSWDRLQVPKPFTRAVVRLAPPLFVSEESDPAALERLREELQRTLDGLSS
jgi:lysophospholipid acyltransferase (LPLAT)-like uncharacterized protein